MNVTTVLLPPLLALELAMTTSTCFTLPERDAMFAAALVADARAPEISADDDLYAGLLGAWDVEVRDRLDHGSFRTSHGEWLFARTLEGRAVQDIWISPPRGQRIGATRVGNRYGSSLRTYEPGTHRWQVTWLNPVSGAFDVLHSRRVGDTIVQEGVRASGQKIRWTFVEITATSFHWTGEALQPDGRWLLEAEFFGTRSRP